MDIKSLQDLLLDWEKEKAQVDIEVKSTYREKKIDIALTTDEDLLEMIEKGDRTAYEYKFSEEFILENKDKLNWKLTCYTQIITPKIIEECEDLIEWDMINTKSYEYLLDRLVVEKHNDKLDWNKICLNPNISLSLIQEFPDKLNWEYISLREDLTEKFILKFSDKLNWKSVITANDLNSDFIKENLHKIDEDNYGLISEDVRENLGID